jgi:hypothetical protein
VYSFSERPEMEGHVISCLVEGCSIRSTVRITGVAKKTVSRLLVGVGNVAAEYQDRVLRNLTTRRVQVDELWGFNYCKQKNVTDKIASKVPGAGDIWLRVAIDADTKLVTSWLLGSRDAGCAEAFIRDLASRLSHRVQLTSDGYRPYLEAVEGAFGADIDYAMLVKLYGKDSAAMTTSAATAPRSASARCPRSSWDVPIPRTSLRAS